MNIPLGDIPDYIDWGKYKWLKHDGFGLFTELGTPTDIKIGVYTKKPYFVFEHYKIQMKDITIRLKDKE